MNISRCLQLGVVVHSAWTSNFVSVPVFCLVTCLFIRLSTCLFVAHLCGLYGISFMICLSELLLLCFALHCLFVI